MYNYIEGKKRIQEILNNKLIVTESDIVPSENNFTFDNAYKAWITAVFVDIRNSTELFAKEDKVVVAKIIKSFTSEIIEILRSKTAEEIGIRGDCVYAIYSTPKRSDIYGVCDLAFYINTLLNMLNKLYSNKGYDEIKAGIGVSTDQELIIKAGRKWTGVNSRVWIGDAVTKASKLSSRANKNGILSIAFSSCTYDNMIDSLVKDNHDAKSWFSCEVDTDLNKFYHGDVIKTKFNNWIAGGMKE